MPNLRAAVPTARHIGESVDVPAGDIGVGAREIGYLYGQYRRMRNEFTSVLTGKGLSYGGSLVRPEATGYGCVYFAEQMLKQRQMEIAGKRVCVSGSGNVAQFAARKLIELKAKVISLSDSGGTLHCDAGFNLEQWEAIYTLKTEQRGRLAELADQPGLVFIANSSPWHLQCDLAMPCATQNELDASAAQKLLDNGCQCVAEGANMPCTLEAIDLFQQARVLFAPGKAANAGGVAVSGLEMSQNATRLHWSADKVDLRLREIMQSIHEACEQYGRQEDDYIDYVAGANIAGFVRVADAMLAQGVI